MSTELMIGHLIEGFAERDAIHVPVIPLVAGERLYRSSRFRLFSGSRDVALSATYIGAKAIGIVDPFLWGLFVEKDERFWGFLFPGTLVGIRHHWSHPDFDSPRIITNEHEKWLRDFCDRWNFDYDELRDAGVGTSDWREIIARGVDLHSPDELGEDLGLFWEHLEAMTGMKFDDPHRSGVVWSCSC